MTIPTSNFTIYPIYVDGDLELNKEDLKDWCYRTVGNIDRWYYKQTSKPGSYCFIFQDPMDAMAFKLSFGIYDPSLV